MKQRIISPRTARVRWALAAIALLLVCCSIVGTRALAGTTGTLRGVAVDAATNTPLVGAKVTVSAPSALFSTTTDKTGHFLFQSLPPDTYTVTLEMGGYQTSTTEGVEVNADGTLDISLSSKATGS